MMETPPSSQALKRRLIVDRKQCVYSQLPQRNQWKSDGATLYKQSFSNKNLVTSRSQDKVLARREISNSSVASNSSNEKPKSISMAPRRQSIHALGQRESPLRKGAKIIDNTSTLFCDLSFCKESTPNTNLQGFPTPITKVS